MVVEAPVDVEADAAAVAADASAREPHRPLGEELAEPVRMGAGRLGVEDPVGVVRVQRRDARLLAETDAAVAQRTVRNRGMVHTWVVCVDPDRGG